MPCDDPACLVVREHDHEPIRRRADVGYLCRRCSDRLVREIAEIPDLYAQLPAVDEHATGDGERVGRGKLSGSPALVSLGVLVLTDPSGFTMEGDGVMPVAPTLAGWCQIVTEELGMTPRSETIVGYCELLRANHRRICGQLWVDEYAGDIRRMWTSLRHYSLAPRPIGRCWGRIRNRPFGGCGVLLYPPAPGTTTIVCPNIECGRTYTGPEIVKLAIQHEREGVA